MTVYKIAKDSTDEIHEIHSRRNDILELHVQPVKKIITL
jgi:hypothetical protein